MLQACSPLQIPVYITTQNRARLGETVSELQPYLSGSHVRADVDKTLFSMITPEIREKLPAGHPVDAIIVGIETHICVTQTALDLLRLGHRVYVLADGVSSINPQERGIALARLRDAGAVVTTSESILFEILGDAKKEGFKEINQLVKSTKGETKAALEVLCKV
jgi:Isochorismatase family